MLIPASLKEGDTIGIISPASPLYNEELNNFYYNINLLKSKGFNIIYGKYTFCQNGYFAGNDRQRAIDLMSMFINKKVSAIICSRGGYGVERIIQYLDFSVIKNNPKIFVGLSNITILLNLFAQKCGFVTYHGPMLKSKLNEFSLKYLISKLGNTNKSYSNNILQDLNIRLFNCSSLAWLRQYTVCGGNLCTIATTLGTSYEINTINKILLLEDVTEPAYKLDRNIIQLLNSDKLNNCSGFILGNLTDCTPSSNIAPERAILSTLLQLKKPILIGFPSGHDDNNITIPIGGTLLQSP